MKQDPYIDLLQRRFPEIDTDQIRIEQTDELARHSYSMNGTPDGLFLRAGSGPAAGVGLNRWLNETAQAHVSFLDHQAGKLSQGPLPLPDTPLQGESWASSRYALNYCCFSYSTAYWDWSEWERLIDWMALKGVNMPLAVTGQEAVWRNVLRRLDLSSDDLDTFVTGPAYLPFGWMGCMDGYTGPLPEGWIDRHLELGQRILERQRSLGMTPVLQGFTGHVPPALLKQRPEAKSHAIRWFDWETHLLDPMDPLFAEVAALYMEEQEALFGTNHLYAADPFIEMQPPSGEPDYLAGLSRAILEGMTRTDPAARWVMQGWCFMWQKDFWSQERIDAFLKAVPDEHLLVLDLYCEGRPMWKETEGFSGKPWAWGNVHNFGNNITLTGAMEANSQGLAEAKASPHGGQLEGIALINEGLGVNPAAFDFLLDRAWDHTPEDPEAWAADYARHRYGTDHPAAENAWRILARTVYRDWKHEFSGLAFSPTVDTPLPSEENQKGVLEARNLLLEAAPSLQSVDTFCFDLINLTRQVLSNQATCEKAELRQAMKNKDRDAFTACSTRILSILDQLDTLLACHPYFRLDTWLAQAVRWGNSEGERHKLRSDALRQLTVWAAAEEVLLDYARKEWSGLLTQFYRPRWQSWIDTVLGAWDSEQDFDEPAWKKENAKVERAWVDRAEIAPLPPAADLLVMIDEIARMI